MYHGSPTLYSIKNGTVWYCLDCELSFHDKKLQYFYKGVLHSQQEMESIAKLKSFL